MAGAGRRWAGWRAEAEAVMAGLEDWRTAHPTATFAQIETALDERLAGLRARLLEDLALASRAADVAAAPVGERPRCPRCGAELAPRGRHARAVLTQRGKAVRLRRDYAVCPSCGTGLFPPG
jgi:ribosomal protein S27AE